MKNIIYLILLLSQLYSAELILNRYEEGTQNIDIYHLVDKNAIICREEYGKGFSTIIRCSLKATVKYDRNNKSDSYFDIKFSGNDIIFYAKNYAKLLPVNDKLINQKSISNPDKYYHWVIIGSKKVPKILYDKSKKSFNYPITVAKNKPPFIGALDLNGEPVKNKQGAITLAQIQKLYENKKYEAVIAKCDEYTKRHVDSFTGDISLYKLRAKVQLAKNRKINYDEIKNESLDWIADNPSNQHIPEVYKYIISSFFARGRLDEGEKYLNLMTSSFSDNVYTQQAMLAFADAIEKSKNRKNEALKIYKDVLYTTKDLDTASQAAMKIADTYLNKKEAKKAGEIFEKILKSNKDYLRKVPEESYKIARKFAKHERYSTAINIAKVIATQEDMREDIDKDIGFWYEQNNQVQEAMDSYNHYLKTYKNGKHEGFVKQHLDGLMIDVNEHNVSKKLAFLDQILQKYEEEKIRKKALEEKVKILMQLKKFDEILAYKNQLTAYKLNDYLHKSAQAYMIDSLMKKKCQQAIALQEDYNISVQTQYDNQYFTCLMKTAHYKRALELVQKHTQSSELSVKLHWLYLSTKAYEKLGRYKKVALAGEDILKLSKVLKISKYDDVLYNIADAYYKLNDYDALFVKTVQRIEKRFPDDVRNIDLFMKVLRFAYKNKDDLMMVNYADKTIKLKRKYHVKAYTPNVEIAYIHALKKIGRPKKALQTAVNLMTEKLNDVHKAEVLYLAGELSISLGKIENGKKFFLKCGEIVKDSTWQKMCAEHLELMSE